MLLRAVTPPAVGSNCPTYQPQSQNLIAGLWPRDRKATFYNHKNVTFVFTEAI